MKLIIMTILLLSIFGCKREVVNGQPAEIPVSKEKAASYLALGDSYTVGESVKQMESFPYQLSVSLNAMGIKVSSPVIIAKTGWTTSDLQSALNTSSLQPKFDIVTLLIGVNNQYRGNSPDVYREEFKKLLQRAIDLSGGKKDHVFILSIPDWGVTPFGLQSGRGQGNIASEIDLFNSINKEESLNMGLSYTDITPDSRKAGTDRELIASDGLHPSGKMYLDWVKALLPKVKNILQ